MSVPAADAGALGSIATLAAAAAQLPDASAVPARATLLWQRNSRRDDDIAHSTYVRGFVIAERRSTL
jgi:hypothetical protein